MINYIVDALKSEEDFDKILYEYMIKNGNLSGKKVCLLLYDQGVLDKKKDKDYNSLYTGKMSAYNFMYKKIKNIEITTMDKYSKDELCTMLNLKIGKNLFLFGEECGR